MERERLATVQVGNGTRLQEEETHRNCRWNDRQVEPNKCGERDRVRRQPSDYHAVDRDVAARGQVTLSEGQHHWSSNVESVVRNL